MSESRESKQSESVMLGVASPRPFPGETTVQGGNRAENGQYVSASGTWSKSKVSLLNTDLCFYTGLAGGLLMFPPKPEQAAFIYQNMKCG